MTKTSQEERRGGLKEGRRKARKRGPKGGESNSQGEAFSSIYVLSPFDITTCS